jgi:SAM-dependent methyltransferase
MNVHPAVHGFGRSPDAYERGRPDYPAAAIDWLCEALEAGPTSTVVDLAAGTGKLTRRLVGRAGTVVAVEPIPEMAAKLRELVGGVEVLQGTAEEMPLPDSSVDSVTVAQAFHWFDQDRAIAEIHRVLRPSGRLGLMWNHRDLSDPLQAAIDDLVNRYRYDTPAERDQRWRKAFAETTLFTPLEQRDFRMVQETDADGLVDRIGSTSFVAALPDGKRLPFLEEVRALAPPDGRVLLRYRTGVYTCRAL